MNPRIMLIWLYGDFFIMTWQVKRFAKVLVECTLHMNKHFTKHLVTCEERCALIAQKELLKISKKVSKSVDMMCMRCYNIQVSQESYALDEGGNRMALEALKQAAERTVGVKQTEKAVVRQAAAIVYIASDADERVTSKLKELCEKNSVSVDCTETMLEIGRACSINVRAAAAAVLKA